MATRHLYVGSLHDEIKADDITRLFSPYGNIEKVKLFSGKGYGFVNFTKTSKYYLSNHTFIIYISEIPLTELKVMLPSPRKI